MDGLRRSPPSPYAATVDTRVAGGGDAGASVSAVAPTKAKARERLKAELIEGLAGEPLDRTQELVARVRHGAGLAR